MQSVDTDIPSILLLIWLAQIQILLRCQKKSQSLLKRHVQIQKYEKQNKRKQKIAF